MAMKTAWWIVLFGMSLALAGIKWLPLAFDSLPSIPRCWLAAFLIIDLLLLGAMAWARVRIVRLFHYRRVNELLWIVMAAEFAESKKPPEDGPAQNASNNTAALQSETARGDNTSFSGRFTIVRAPD
ncbi:MAG: hypothetical protein ABR924_10200 [Terracidiphilus sp.]